MRKQKPENGSRGRLNGSQMNRQIRLGVQMMGEVPGHCVRNTERQIGPGNRALFPDFQNVYIVHGEVIVRSGIGDDLNQRDSV